MTSFTPNTGLPYPDGTDPPCEGAQQLNDLKNAIFDYLDSAQDRLARLRARPLVSVTRVGIDTPVSGVSAIVDGAPIWFNVVEQDDMRAANLIADDRSITLGNADTGSVGEFLVGFTVQCPDDPSVGIVGHHNRINLRVDGVNAEIFDVDQSNGPDQQDDFYGVALGLLSFPGPEAKIQIVPGSNQTERVAFARLWAVRLGDA